MNGKKSLDFRDQVLLEIRYHELHDLVSEFSMKFAGRGFIIAGLGIVVTLKNEWFPPVFVYLIVLSFWYMNVFYIYRAIYKQKDRLLYLYFLKDAFDEIYN